MSSAPASQLYKIYSCLIETQEIAVFSREDFYSHPGHILLNSGLLRNRCTDFNVLHRRLLGSMPASQLYKVHLYRIKTQEIGFFSRG